MDEDFKELDKIYKNIKKLGYVKSLRRGYGGIGYTFECLMGKEEDSNIAPDFKSIEIKTMRRFGKNIISFFTITPDGDYHFPMERILEKLGYPDKIDKNYKVFNKDFYSGKWSYIGFYKKGKLVVDWENEKINLIAESDKNKEIKLDVSWSFDVIKERLNAKLNNLALVVASSKKINDEEYFHYNKIEYYKCRGFDTFIKLIDTGVIRIDIKISVIRDGEFKGNMRSRGANFSMSYKDFDKLFYKVRVE